MNEKTLDLTFSKSMSRSILRAMIQLFALVAKPGNKLGIGRFVVENFLRRELGTEQVNEYLKEFDNLLAQHFSGEEMGDSRKRRASSSVKVLRICTQINEELTYPQKCFVFIRFTEFLSAGEEPGAGEMEFLDTVASTFNLDAPEQHLIRYMCGLSGLPEEQEDLLWISGKIDSGKNKHLLLPGMEGEAMLVYLPLAESFYLKYSGSGEYYLNGQVINAGIIYPFPPGSVMRGPKINPLYYSDLAGRLRQNGVEKQIVFNARNVEYRFPNGRKALHRFSFTEYSGNLIGIMGSSGAGKSTLLNVLNGNEKPSAGQVLINGLNIHDSGNQARGMIGYVSQDDILIEELTVFQNLWYNALLCFEGMDEDNIRQKVVQTLLELGLEDIRDLKVGSPMNKVISGGQRKRLNIALELIREPPVIFLDEPTSGLSSRDSENIMDLLKELALRGKLVFVVIHQPSSNIFKLFDRLILLDVGGFPIYYGNPVESVVYFRSIIDHVKAGESECPECGHVNPEQLFDILESKVVNEHGQITQHRKISPREWNIFFKRSIPPTEESDLPEQNPLPDSYRKPSRLRQFRVFFSRDLLSKVANRQYLLLNLLEAPVLALLMGYFLRFSKSGSYNYYDNLNVPAYLFICVIASLFFGLTVSAEEIFRDRRIRRREKFLNLSWGTYLTSKISLLFILSAIQSISFVLVGHNLLEMRGLYSDDWLILFSVSAFANLLGLNISSAFNSVITIYILIPLLIIPQLLLSGVLVKYEDLNPSMKGSDGQVPLAANLMASRWAYEAVAVNRFTRNPCQKSVLQEDIIISESAYLSNYWIPRMEELVAKKVNGEAEVIHLKTVLNAEIGALNLRNIFRKFPEENFELNPEELGEKVSTWLDIIRQQANQRAMHAGKSRDLKMKGIDPSMIRSFTNEQLNALVKRSDQFEKIRQNPDGTFWRAYEPVYQYPEKGWLAGGHFFAPYKRFGTVLIETRWANLMMIWLMTLTLAFSLQADLLARLLRWNWKVKLQKISTKR